MYEDLFDPDLPDLARNVIARLYERLSRYAPCLSKEAMRWITGLSKTTRAEDYFLGSRAQLLIVPRQLSQHIGSRADAGFEFDIAYSSISAYYYVRFVDNIMDAHRNGEPRLLPLLGFFHSQFQSAFAPYFPPHSTFWDFFHSTWASMAEATFLGATTPEPTCKDFVRFARGKSGGCKIPLTAVCLHYERPDLLDSWCGFSDALVTWSQMVDDVFDWMIDLTSGTPTYFLSEAKRRKHPDESVTVWALREGVEWGCREALREFQRIFHLARQLGSGDLLRYLECRRRQLSDAWEQVQVQLPILERLAVSLE